MTIGGYFCDTQMKTTRTTHLHNIRQEKANSQKCGQNGEEKKTFQKKKKDIFGKLLLRKSKWF